LTAETEKDGIDIVGDVGDHRAEVLGPERHPLALDDLAACAAIADREPEDLRVGEGVVLGDHRDLLVALVLQHVFAETGHPHRAVAVEAEEVRRGIDEGRLERARRAVDHDEVRHRLAVVAHGDAFGAGERPDDQLHLVLLDQLAGRAQRGIRAGVGGRDDELEFAPGDLVAEFLGRDLDAADAVFTAGRQRARQRRHHTDLEFFLGMRGRCSRDETGRDGGRKRLAHRSPPCVLAAPKVLTAKPVAAFGTALRTR
jgi:hypothetical protein